MKTSNTNSLAHTTWDCKYHLVFAPKFRRQIIYRELRADIGKILRELCERKGIEIVEAQCCPDHVHMLVKIPPKYSVSEIMGYLKGKSSLIIFAVAVVIGESKHDSVVRQSDKGAFAAAPPFFVCLQKKSFVSDYFHDSTSFHGTAG